MSMLNPLPPKRKTKANMSALNFNTSTKIGKCLGILNLNFVFRRTIDISNQHIFE